MYFCRAYSKNDSKRPKCVGVNHSCIVPFVRQDGICNWLSFINFALVIGNSVNCYFQPWYKVFQFYGKNILLHLLSSLYLDVSVLHIAKNNIFLSPHAHNWSFRFSHIDEYSVGLFDGCDYWGAMFSPAKEVDWEAEWREMIVWLLLNFTDL